MKDVRPIQTDNRTSSRERVKNCEQVKNAKTKLKSSSEARKSKADQRKLSECREGQTRATLPRPRESSNEIVRQRGSSLMVINVSEEEISNLGIKTIINK